MGFFSFISDAISWVGETIVDVIEVVVDVAEDIVTGDIEGLVDTAVGMVEGIVHTITHPTEDPFATIMLAVSVYSGYNSYSAEAAVGVEAQLAADAAWGDAIIQQGASVAEANIAASAAAEAVYVQAGASPGFFSADIVTPTGTVVNSGTGSLASGTLAGGPNYGAPLSGPLFDAIQTGAEVGKDFAINSIPLAEAGVVVKGGKYSAAGELLEGADAVEAAQAALYDPIPLDLPAFGGVGAESAAGSMVGYGGGPGGYVSPSAIDFLSDLPSAWTDTDFSASEDFEFSTDYAESEAAWGDKFVEGITKPFEKVKNFGSEFLDDITEEYKKFADDPMGEAWEYAEREAERRYPFISDPKIPTSTDELIELGVDMAVTNFANWSPTISYQAGGDPGSATSESYPSFTRAETGILGDPFNLEGQDLALTASGLASQLQQQRGLPFGQQEMGMAPTFYDPTAFRQRQAPAEELKQLMDPSYAVNQYQQPMVNEMINQLNANAQGRGLQASTEGVSRGIAPLLSKLRQDNLASLNRAAGLDLEATAGAMGQRSGDITAQQGYQDIGLGADVARKNITLNSLLALAQMSKPTIIGGTTARGTGTAASPGTVFSGAVPVGNILSTGWDWLTNDNNENAYTYI